MESQNKMPSYPEHAALYVGDLTEDVTETILYEIFSQPAPIESLRICRDSKSGRSLGYGYVNYHTVDDADRALDVLNFTRIKGRPCRIMWKNADKASTNNVFVKNLDKDFDNKALYDTFSLFGTIISCKVATDTQGRSLGHGFVQYEKEESLVDAIERVNGMQIGKNKVYCARHKRKDERESKRDQFFSNIYAKVLGGYPNNMTADDIKAIFEGFGQITSFCAKTDTKDRPFCYVNFEDVQSARKAVDTLHDRRFNSEGVLLSKEETAELDAKDAEAHALADGRDLSASPKNESEIHRFYVQRHESRAERDLKLKNQFQPTKAIDEKDKNVVLYTRHFPEDYMEEDLRALFEPYGIVTSIRLVKDENGNNKGFGFVCFEEHAHAQKALLDLNDQVIGDGHKLYVSYLEPKDVRSQRLKAQLHEKLHAYSTPQYPRPVRTPNKPDNRKPHHAKPVYTDDIADFKKRLEGLSFQDRKQAIGDHLYHRIVSQIPGLAGKVTGMMLEMDNDDLLRLIGNEKELQLKIDEALEVLRNAAPSTSIK